MEEKEEEEGGGKENDKEDKDDEWKYLSKMKKLMRYGCESESEGGK